MPSCEEAAPSAAVSNHEMNVGASFETRPKSTAPQGEMCVMDDLDPKPL
jgi:hypothetical protein